jgi:excisionase family DNA binding protein
MTEATDWLTTAEAALKAGMSRERLVRKVEKGEIVGRVFGGRWQVQAASLDGFLAKQGAK